MSISEDIYTQASVWLSEVADHQTIEILIDLPAYGWVQIFDITMGPQMVIAHIRRDPYGSVEDLAFDVNVIKGVRLSPVEFSAREKDTPTVE
ncbi:hypothetical protein LH128_05915 [Sphingomonas sp. LH128]|uniref:hypothetical protein n=1 Tax=Sphingomonas sp. LH128 TaxID=473781 RepID=UPI00027CA6EE|nr:hypothetical protein [Sphingomonas sp. LH128]EJU14011.1 hypothetical protein LH128_05915 [Sphingomonas sp. LH128]